MKFILIILIAIIPFSVFSQVPQGINYQSIIRNSTGAVIPSALVDIEFKLYNGLAGPLVYSEKHTTNSNSIGMVNLVIGNGTPTFSSFASITWSNGIAYEVYVNANLVGTKQVFLSVPYALYSTPPKLTLTSGTILSSGPLTNSVTLPNPGASTTITPGPGGNVFVNGIAPSYTVSAPNYSLTNPIGTNNIQLSNGSNVSLVTLPSPTLGISSGTLNVGATSINLSNTTDGFWGLKGNTGNNSTANFIGNIGNVDLNLRTNNQNRLTILGSGNVGIGINTPSNIFSIGNGTLEKFNINSSNGSINFLDDQATITFPDPSATPKPMIHMFASGTSNSNRMVIAHSSSFSNWGLQYDDINDRFNFLSAGSPVLTADLINLRVGVGTNAPQTTLDVAGNVKITDGTQAAGKVLTSDAMGNGAWNYPLSPTKFGNYTGFTTIANTGFYTYYTGANLLVINPTVSGVVLLHFNARYNFNISLPSQISLGIYVNITGVAPTTTTPLTASVIAGWATAPTGGGFGDIPVSFVHSLNVSAGTTYYVWVGANTLNFNQTSASFGPVKLTATLHQASGL